MNAIDTNVLLWQVLGEAAQQLRRWRDMGKMTPAEFAQHIKAFRAFGTVTYFSRCQE